MSTADRFGIGSSIPVIRMLGEQKTRAFYLEFLGFSVDWEHRFEPANPESPLYMQIRLGDALIHLDGHADQDAPVSEVRIPTRDLQGYALHISERAPDGEKPEPVDPRYEGKPTDLNLVDPSGNLLVFWLREEA